MCRHEYMTFHSLVVCRRCGLVRLPGGAVMFDRRLPELIGGGKNHAQKKRAVSRPERIY